MNPLGVWRPTRDLAARTPRACFKRLGIQLPPDQEHAFWREEIRKMVTYWNAAPGEEEPDTQARVLALITKIESDLKRCVP